MKKLLFLLLLVSFSVAGCKKEDDELGNGDYLIFGTFYGFCEGETCIEIYKIDNKQLYEDQNDNYSLNNFDFEEINNNDYASVKELVEQFPEKLFDEPSTIGCPDCTDQGGVFILYKKNGVKHEWRIDNFTDDLPNYIQEYTDLVKEKIDLINS